MGYDYAADLLGVPSTGEPEFRAGNSAPAVTVKYPEQGEGADFWTLIKSGLVDHPETKLKVAAAARFPQLAPEQREKLYGFKDGELYYVDPQTGQSFFETSGAWQRFKREVANVVANAPAEILSMVGLGSPLPGGAAVGAAAGEGVRQAAGRYLYGEEQSIPERALKVGLSGAAAQLGAALGRKGIRAGETAVTRATTPPSAQAGVTRGMRLMREAGDFAPIDAAEEARVRSLMQMYGIAEPTAVETTGSARLRDRWTLLGDLPATAETVQKVKTTRMGEVTKAIQDYMQGVSPVSDPLEAGKVAQSAAEAAVEGAKKARTVKVEPLYEKAFANAGKADTQSAIEELDGLLKDLPERGGSLRPALNDVREMLHRTETQTITNPDGTVVTKDALVPEWDVRRLDSIKKELDAVLNGSHKRSKDITPAVIADKERRIALIRDKLVQAADAASPDYAAARAAYQSESPAVEALQRGAVGSAASLKGDKVTAATQRLLDSAFTSPETVKLAKGAIRAKDPKAWDAVVRQYLEKFWAQVPEAVEGGSINYGGRFAGKLKAKGRMEILKAAMEPAQYQALTDFVEVMGRTGRIFGKESATATRQVALDEMKAEGRQGAAGKLAAALQTDLTAPGRKIGDWIESRVTTPRAQMKILDALQDPRAAAELKRLKTLKPRSRELLEGMSAWLGAIGAAEGQQAFGRATTPDQEPGTR